QTNPMLGYSGVQKRNAADWQIRNGAKEQTTKDRRVPFSTANQPVKRDGSEQDSQKRLQFAPGRAVRTRFTRSFRMRLHIAVHVKIDRKQNESGIFTKGARGEDRPNEQWRRRVERGRRHMFGGQPQGQINHGDEERGSRRRQQCLPVFFQQEDRAPEHEKNKAGLLAQRREQK